MENESHRHVTVRLPGPINRWLRIRAAELDTSRSEIIRAILAKEVATQTEGTQSQVTSNE